jgi:hypothetical protein
MHLIYIDDSYEKPTQTYAAIAVPATEWREYFTRILHWRRALKRQDGILVYREFHATEFVVGRGRLGPNIVTKYRRSVIFRGAFQLLNGMDQLRIFTSCRKSNPE